MNNRFKNSILIVDDTLRNVQVIGTMLKQEGYQIIVAQDGVHALEMANKVTPDLILLDIMMPKMDGFEACRQLKANRATHDIPIIFMTALSDTEDKVKGFECGAVDYVTKPVQQQEILARINTHLSLRNLQKVLEQQKSASERQKHSIEQQRVELHQQSSETEALTHIITQELKKMLATQASFIKILKKDLEQLPHSANYFRELEQGQHKMAQLTDNLHLFIEAISQEIDIEAPDMNTILSEVRYELAPLIKQWRAEIVIPNTWPSVWGYSPWVKKAWTIYITNALKYGGRPPRVELGAHAEKDAQIRFWVRDNGPGLATEQQNKLFTPFSQLNQVRVEEGYGIELTLIKELIARSRGRVGFEALPRRGSVFYFTLPAIS